MPAATTVTGIFTNSKEQSPSWKLSPSPGQEIPHILRKKIVHYRVPQEHASCPDLSQINPVHDLQTDVFKIHFNISSHPSLVIPDGLLYSGFPTKNLPASLHSLQCSTNLALPLLVSRIISGDYRSWSYSLRRLLHYPFNSSLLDYSIFPNT